MIKMSDLGTPLNWRNLPEIDDVTAPYYAHAVNCHDDLVEALHDLLTRPTDGAARVRARAALAKACGE